MKKLAVATVFMACMAGGTGVVNAAPQNTATIGYAYINASLGIAKLDLNGFNLGYRYDFNDNDSGMGIISSFTWAKQTLPIDNINYYSFLAGPVYRVNKFFSIYGQIGVADGGIEEGYLSINKVGFAYGAGVQINPIQNLAITAGYEGAILDTGSYGISNITPNGFNIGIGYSF